MPEIIHYRLTYYKYQNVQPKRFRLFIHNTAYTYYIILCMYGRFALTVELSYVYAIFGFFISAEKIYNTYKTIETNNCVVASYVIKGIILYSRIL